MEPRLKTNFAIAENRTLAAVARWKSRSDELTSHRRGQNEPTAAICILEILTRSH